MTADKSSRGRGEKKFKVATVNLWNKIFQEGIWTLMHTVEFILESKNTVFSILTTLFKIKRHFKMGISLFYFRSSRFSRVSNSQKVIHKTTSTKVSLKSIPFNL